MKIQQQLHALGTTIFLILFLPLIWLCDKLIPHGDSISEQEAESTYKEDTDEKL